MVLSDLHHHQPQWLIGCLHLEVKKSLPGIGPERSAGDTYKHEVNAARLQCVPEQEWGRVMKAGTPFFQIPVLPTLRSKLNRRRAPYLLARRRTQQ